MPPRPGLAVGSRPASGPISGHRRRALWAACALLPLVEAVPAQAVGLVSGVLLAPQLTGPLPVGVLHDLRWALVFHPSWPLFALFLAGVAVLRAALTAGLVLLAWPRDAPAPALRPLARAAATGTAAGLVLLLPAATLVFAMGVVPLWWFAPPAAMAATIPVVLLAHAGAEPGWWRRRPSARALGWTVVAGVVASGASLVAAVAPPWVALLPVVAGGALNAVVWRGLAATVAGRAAERAHAPRPRDAPRLWPFGAGAGALLAGAVAAFVVAEVSSSVDLARRARQVRPPRGLPVLVATGFRTDLRPGEADFLGPPLRYRRFSYRGLGPQGAPLPYGPRDTYASLDVLADRMAVQVRALHALTGRPVTLVAESEGTMIAKLYLLRHPRAPVAELVQLSPVLRPGRVFYPPPGSSGFGVAARPPLHGLTALVSWLAFPADLDMPLLRSMARDADVLRPGMACPLPGLRQAIFLPLVNALAEPPPVGGGVPLAVLPTVHGGIAGQGEVTDAVTLHLAKREVPERLHWKLAATVARGAAAAWQAPTLPLGLNPAWRVPPGLARCREG